MIASSVLCLVMGGLFAYILTPRAGNIANAAAGTLMIFMGGSNIFMWSVHGLRVLFFAVPLVIFGIPLLIPTESSTLSAFRPFKLVQPTLPLHAPAVLGLPHQQYKQ